MSTDLVDSKDQAHHQYGRGCAVRICRFISMEEHTLSTDTCVQYIGDILKCGRGYTVRRRHIISTDVAVQYGSVHIISWISSHHLMFHDDTIIVDTAKYVKQLMIIFDLLATD